MQSKTGESQQEPDVKRAEEIQAAVHAALASLKLGPSEMPTAIHSLGFLQAMLMVQSGADESTGRVRMSGWIRAIRQGLELPVEAEPYTEGEPESAPTAEPAPEGRIILAK